ncbi:Rv1733c family protein [Streptomyces sp. NPDC054813]
MTAHPGAKAGTPVAVWTDRQGRLRSRPLTPDETAFQAAWTCTLVALATAGAVLGGAQLVRVRLERRRLERWDEEWARVDSPRGWNTG